MTEENKRTNEEGKLAEEFMGEVSKETQRALKSAGAHVTQTGYYCDGPQCRRTTPRICVRMENRYYYHCTVCGRILEPRDQVETNRPIKRSYRGIASDTSSNKA